MNKPLVRHLCLSHSTKMHLQQKNSGPGKTQTHAFSVLSKLKNKALWTIGPRNEFPDAVARGCIYMNQRIRNSTLFRKSSFILMMMRWLHVRNHLRLFMKSRSNYPRWTPILRKKCGQRTEDGKMTDSHQSCAQVN